MIGYCWISRLVSCSWYTDCVYLPTFSESNAWDFFFVMTGISGKVLATSKHFHQLSEDFWTLPKMSADVRKTFQHFRSYLKDNNNILVCFDFVRTQKRTQGHHLTSFWIEFSLFTTRYRTIYPYLRVRHENLSLMCEINVFSPQVWDSCLMRESWQV